MANIEKDKGPPWKKWVARLSREIIVEPLQPRSRKGELLCLYKIVHVRVITLDLIILELFDKVLFRVHARPAQTFIFLF